MRYSYIMADLSVETFFSQFFVSGGPIVWLVLLPMSVVMLYLGIDLLIRLRRGRLLPAGRAGEIMKLAGSHGVLSLPKRLEPSTDLIGRAVGQTVGRCRRRGLEGTVPLEYAAESLQEQGLALLRKAEGCHLIGTVAPMIGLFGTVYGMIKAFTVLASAGGQPAPEQLAASISVALVTTFWGLLIAIPALFFHGFCRTRIESLIGEASTETEVLLERLAELERHQRLTAQRVASVTSTLPPAAEEAEEPGAAADPIEKDVTLELEIEDE